MRDGCFYYHASEFGRHCSLCILSSSAVPSEGSSRHFFIFFSGSLRSRFPPLLHSLLRFPPKAIPATYSFSLAVPCEAGSRHFFSSGFPAEWQAPPPSSLIVFCGSFRRKFPPHILFSSAVPCEAGSRHFFILPARRVKLTPELSRLAKQGRLE